MQVTVFGASGKVGKLVVERLLSAGHTVTVFVHYNSPFIPSEQLKIIKSDVHNAAFVEAAVRGSDAVISTLGSWHTPTKDVLSAAMRFIIPAMQQSHVHRIITVTGSGALVPADKPSFGARIQHAVIGIVAKDVLRDSEMHLQLLADSGLAWTCVRSPAMRDGEAGAYRLTAVPPKPWERVSRAAVADALVAQLTELDWLQAAPHIHQS